MHSPTSLTAAALLAANIPITTANGQGMQPQAVIAYRSSVGVNDTVKTIDYLTWNSNMTLADISATEVWAAGGNAPATANGYNCTFESRGNPGGLYTVSYQGPHANMATNPVEIKWICCGGCATNASAPTASSAASSSSTAIAPTGNGTSASNTSTTILTSGTPSASASAIQESNFAGDVSAPIVAVLALAAATGFLGL